MFSEDDSVGSAESLITVGDRKYDINNIPGDVKRALIESGKINPNKLMVYPPGVDKNNIPGDVKRALFEKHKKNVKGVAKIKGNPYSVGDMVLFRKESRQVVAISSKNPDLVKLTDKKKDTTGWIHYDKLKAVRVDEQD